MDKAKWRKMTIEERSEWFIDKSFFGAIILWIICGTIWIFVKW